MCGSRTQLMWAGVLCALLVAPGLYAGTVDVSCASGVQDYDGQWLKGSAGVGRGDLVQVIYAGVDGEIDLPDELGNTTDDDSLLGTTFIGAGFPFNPDEGKFAQQFTHDLLADGNLIYARAWNDSTVAEATHYGESQLATVSLTGGFGSVDFPTWTTGDLVVPIELVSFHAVRTSQGVRLTWVTQSETENFGFVVYRSVHKSGPYRKISEEIIPGAGNSQERIQYAYDDAEAAPDTNYYYKLADVDFAGRVRFHGPVEAVVSISPRDFALAQNYPNPFNPSTTIAFDISEPAFVSLKIYNVQGQLVKTLVEERIDAAHYQVMWDATDALGNLVPSGTYIYRLESNGLQLTKTMQLLK